MKSLKNFLFSILIGVCTVSMVPCAQAENSDGVDSLLNVVEESVIRDNIVIDSEGVLSLGENTLSVESSYIKNGEKIKEESSLILNLDVSTLPEEFVEEFDGIFADFKINVETIFSVFFDQESKDMFYEVGAFDLDLTTEDGDTKNIIEGAFEFTEFFTGETYYLNVKKLIKEFESFAEDYEELYDLDLINFEGEDAAVVLELFLKSGFFNVSLSGDTYTITLKDEIKEIDRQALIDAINKMDFLDTEIREEIVEELEQPITENTYKEINLILDKVMNYFDFKVNVVVDNADLINNVEFDFIFKISEILAENNLDWEVEDLTYVQDMEIEYQRKTFSFPKEDRNEINLNTIFGMFLTFEKQWEEEWENYDTYEDDYGYDDYWTQWEEEQAEKKAKTIEDIKNKFGEETWFVPYVLDLIEKNVMDDFYKPDRSVSGYELGDLLDNAIYVTSSYDVYLKDIILDKIANYEPVSKLDAVNYVVEVFFLKNTNQVAYARERGIVSEAFNVAKAREQNLTLAELVKMLSVAIELAEEDYYGAYSY